MSEIYVGTHNLAIPYKMNQSYTKPRNVLIHGILGYMQIFMNKGMSWSEALELAKEVYFKNDQPFMNAILRVPKLYEVKGDLRVFDDKIISRRFELFTPHFPRSVGYNLETSQQLIEQFNREDLVANKYPLGMEIPERLEDELIDFFHLLTFFPKSQWPKWPPYWPQDGDVHGVAQIEANFAKQILRDNRWFLPLYQKLQFPDHPMAPFEKAAQGLERRPFVLVHFDIHTLNLFDTPNGLRVIDGELAFPGDPLWDITMCLHLSHFPKAQEQRIIEKYFQQVFHCMEQPKKRRVYDNNLKRIGCITV